jgi:hypothetical protein
VGCQFGRWSCPQAASQSAFGHLSLCVHHWAPPCQEDRRPAEPSERSTLLAVNLVAAARQTPWVPGRIPAGRACTVSW